MKKIIALLLVLVMALSLMACGSKEQAEDTKETQGTEDTTPAAELPASALEIAETIWNSYKEEDKFSIYGGNSEYHFEQLEKDETYQMPSVPGVYDMTYAENLANSMAISAADMENVAAAATMTHSMNANSFSCAVLELKEGTSVADFAKNTKEGILSNQWICGAPEQMLIAAFGEKYVLVAFGGEAAMTPFEGYLTAAYADAQILYSESMV